MSVRSTMLGLVHEGREQRAKQRSIRDPGEGLGTNAEPRKEGEPVPDIDARIERLLDQLEDPYLTEAKEQTLRRRLKTLQEFQERERVKSA